MVLAKLALQLLASRSEPLRLGELFRYFFIRLVLFGLCISRIYEFFFGFVFCP